MCQKGFFFFKVKIFLRSDEEKDYFQLRNVEVSMRVKLMIWGLR